MKTNDCFLNDDILEQLQVMRFEYSQMLSRQVELTDRVNKMIGFVEYIASHVDISIDYMDLISSKINQLLRSGQTISLHPDIPDFECFQQHVCKHLPIDNN